MIASSLDSQSLTNVRTDDHEFVFEHEFSCETAKQERGCGRYLHGRGIVVFFSLSSSSSRLSVDSGVALPVKGIARFEEPQIIIIVTEKPKPIKIQLLYVCVFVLTKN